MLSDRDILEEVKAGGIILDPFDPSCVQPASVDVHLDDLLLVPNTQPTAYYTFAEPHSVAIDTGIQLDPGSNVQQKSMDSVHIQNRDHYEKFWLPPGGVALGCTAELLTFNPDASLAADIAGCSSLGRWFLFVHVTAGFIDPGWSGRLTLELYNASPWWLRLWSGMRIAQLRFYYTHGVPTRSYLDTGHYAGAHTAQPSQYKG
jgi:dCTP deaminase